jgi:hypothetical protein
MRGKLTASLGSDDIMHYERAVTSAFNSARTRSITSA